MPLKRRIGYDIHLLYSKEEIEKMYVQDGMEPTQAHGKALEVWRALNNMRFADRQLWKRVRENELTDGLEPELLEEYQDA